VPGKTPREAVNAYVEPLQKCVAIVCEGVLRPNNRDTLDKVSILNLPDPAPLRGRSDRLLDFKQQYKIIKDAKNGPYRVTTRYYGYILENENAEEIIGYHWHPEGQSNIRFPHFHIGPAVEIGMEELKHKTHLPTGRVAFEDVVELLITNFGIKPDRSNWQEVVNATKEKFTQYKAW
jgi:hypothetical protein